MLPGKKMILAFQYEGEAVQWSIEQLRQYAWQVCCEHPVYIQRFGSNSSVTTSLADLLYGIEKTEADFDFFVGMLISFMERKACNV